MVQKDGEKAKAVRKVSQTHHDEIVLKPQREGKYTYVSFHHKLCDAYEPDLHQPQRR